MRLRQIVDALSLAVLAGQDRLEADVTGGYAADLLSCAMAGARKGNVWVTLQGHVNVVAVAAGELTGIIVAEAKPVAADMLARAEEAHIPVMTTPESTFGVVGRLWDLGVRD